MGISRNTFEGGMNKDISPKAMSANKYFEANDITLTSDNSYSGVKPLLGDSSQRILYDNSTFSNSSSFSFDNYYHNDVVNIMGVKSCELETSEGKKKAIVVFSSRASEIEFDGFKAVNSLGSELFEIYFVLLSDQGDVSSLVKVYSKEAFNKEYYKYSVDSVLAGDGNIDVIYFTNQVDPPMQLRCTTTEFEVGQDMFSDADMDLIRLENARPPYAVVTGEEGSVPCGTYQFASRMINSSNNLYTKWSLLSSPIPVFNEITNLSIPDSLIPSGGINEISKKSIKVYLDFNQEDAGSYDHYQLAVVKGNSGTGIPKSNAFVLEPSYKGSASYPIFDYTGESKESTIAITDIVVDDAQIESFKTLKVKNNFLLGGNVKYFDLEYDNGIPEISIAESAIFNKEVKGNGAVPGNTDLVGDQIDYYSDQSEMSMLYFRDEVYRFAITYHDRYGNWSEPSVLDFSSQIGNKAASGCIDWRFPSLTEEPILANSYSYLRGIRLDLNGIKNHPSWARGFAILRAKRIKDIVTQTPLVPTMSIQPMNARITFNGDQGYPQLGDPVASNAQAPSSTYGTLAPKNLSLGVLKHIIRGDTHSQWYYGYKSEIEEQHIGGVVRSDQFRSAAQAAACKYVHIVFPPNNIYNHNGAYYEPYVHKPSDILDIVDIQNLKGDKVNFEVTPSPAGWNDSNTTRLSLDYSYTLTMNDNYTNAGKSNTPIKDLSYIPNNNITEYIELSAGQDNAIITSSVKHLRSSKFGDYKGLEAEGLNEGSIPSNQRMGLVVLSNGLIDVNYKMFDSATGLNVATDVSNDEVTFESTSAFNLKHTNNDMIQDANYGEATSPYRDALVPFGKNYSALFDRTFIPIANIRRGLDDFRYGGKESSHEYVFTGAYARLSSDDVLNNVPFRREIYGGDCSYDLHSFKISDSQYVIPDNKLLYPGGGGIVTTDEHKRYFKERFGHSFIGSAFPGKDLDDPSGGTAFEVGRPIAVDSMSQGISVLLESEIRSTFMNRGSGMPLGIGNTVHTISKPASLGDARVPLFYDYNLDYSLPNNNKIFVKRPKLDDSNSIFKSRIQYSDQRIYQSSEIGFDRFRVGNIYDTDESKGAITKLVNSIDKIYSLQERGIAYIPVQGNIIETSDSINLSIRSADVIGIPQYINDIYGCKHFRTISNSHDGFFFVDSDNKKVVKMQNGVGLTPISDIGMISYFNSKLSDINSKEIDLFGVYDIPNKEYFLFKSDRSLDINDGWGVIFSEKAGSWTSSISNGNLFGVLNGSNIFGNLFMVGKFSGKDVSIRKMNSSEDLFILGKEMNSYVDLYSNDQAGIPKVFDVFNIDSEYKLKSIRAETFNTVGNASQLFVADVSADTQREGSYKLPLPRDNGNPNARLRGIYSKVRLLFPNYLDDAINARPELFGLLSIYRESMRHI